MKLGPGEPLKKRMRYPHMLREDHEIWDQFIDTSSFPIERVWYDVHVGPGMALPPDCPPWMHKQVAAICRLRIDVLAMVHGTYWIIELKPEADDKALGQILCYHYHFSKEMRTSSPIMPVVITDQVNSNAIEVFEHFGIVCIEVGSMPAKETK